MGMVGGLTQLTSEELERVRRDSKLLPYLESEIVEADASRSCDLDKAWHGVHYLLVGDAGTEERRWVLPLYFLIGASMFIVTALFGRILVMNGGEATSSGLLFRILRIVGIVSFAVCAATGLLWLKVSGVRRLRMAFSRKRTLTHAFVPPDAVRKAMLGGTWLGSIDDTSAYYATAEEVRTLAPILTALSDVGSILRACTHSASTSSAAVDTPTHHGSSTFWTICIARSRFTRTPRDEGALLSFHAARVAATRRG